MSFFSRPYGARCPAVRKSTPVHAAQKLAVRAHYVSSVSLFVKISIHPSALRVILLMPTFERDHTQYSMSVDGIVLLYHRSMERWARVWSLDCFRGVYRHCHQSRPRLPSQRSILAEQLSSYLDLHPSSTIRPRGCLEFSDAQSNRFCINSF